MTLNAITLDQYFHLIVNKQQKEPTMFENLKTHFMSLWATPVAFVQAPKTKLMDDDYYAFEMVTNEWVDEHGVTRPIKHSLIVEPHEGTWMEVLDNILDEMEKHYGYSIKEQVYYSVEFPINEIDDRTGQPFAGYGRCLNDQMLQQLLLAFPEVYETTSFVKPAKNVFE